MVGCPVRARDWILPLWWRYVRAAVDNAGLELETLVFVVGRQDLATRACIHDISLEVPTLSVVIDEPTAVDIRDWCPDRHDYMAIIRNRLLRAVRWFSPDWFWSVDSDILVHPDALKSALTLRDRFDAIGSKCYLSENDTRWPNWGMWAPNAGGLMRYDTELQIDAPIIMALKLMSPKAYNVDYAGHWQGEDLGWSFAVTAAGLKLGWDGSVASRHLFSRESLERRDVRLGGDLGAPFMEPASVTASAHESAARHTGTVEQRPNVVLQG